MRPVFVQLTERKGTRNTWLSQYIFIRFQKNLIPQNVREYRHEPGNVKLKNHVE